MRRLFVLRLIRLYTLEIQQLTKLSLLMLHWRIDWEIVRVICIEIKTI